MSMASARQAYQVLDDLVHGGAIHPCPQLSSEFLPYWLVTLVIYCLNNRKDKGPLQRQTHLVDVFCGPGFPLAAAFAAANLTTYAFDLEYGWDILKKKDILQLVNHVLMLVPGGLLWLGPPCNTWVWMSQSYYARNAANLYGGDSNNVRGNQANAMGYLVAGFMRLATWLGVQFCVEQPSSSRLQHFPPIKKAVEMTMAASFQFHLGAFDSNLGCQKNMRVLTNSCWGRDLESVRCFLHAQARPDIYRIDLGGVTGGPGLRQTGHYPSAFAQYVLDHWRSSNFEVPQTFINWRLIYEAHEPDEAAKDVFHECLR